MSKDTNNSSKLQGDRLALWKKARKKHFGNFLAMLLYYVPDNKLQKSYINSWWCGSVIEQTGKKLTSQYCKTRWCNTCNNIRTAKLIHTYSPALKELSDPYMITLSMPNVPAGLLAVAIKHHNKAMTKIINAIKPHYPNISGIRKIECTYNHIQDTYHPHLHVIVSGEAEANLILDSWLDMHPTALRDKGNQITKCYGNYEIELFKYFTKIVTKVGNVHRLFPTALNTIFESLKGVRIYASFGSLYGLKIDEDFNELDAYEYEQLPDKKQSWIYDAEIYDWYNEMGQLLTYYTPTENLLTMLNNNFNGDVSTALVDFQYQHTNRAVRHVQKKYKDSLKPSSQF